MALVSNRVDRWLSVRASLIVVALVVSGATPFSSKPALAIEPVQRIVSPGGIEALLIESHEVGLISMRISFRGGAVQDPADKPGVAYFTGYMFNEGAGDLSPLDLTRRLTRLGSSFAGDASTESIQISVSAPSAQRDEAFRLLKLAIASPRFDPEPMERARRSALASLAQEGLNPGSVATRRLTELLYGPTRYAIPVKGTPDAVARISADDVRAYRQRVFARDTLRVAVAGDIDAPTLARLLDDLFAVLPAKADLQAVPAIRPAAAGAIQRDQCFQLFPTERGFDGALMLMLDGDRVPLQSFGHGHSPGQSSRSVSHTRVSHFKPPRGNLETRTLVSGRRETSQAG